MKKKQDTLEDILNNFENRIKKYFKKLNNNPIAVVNSWVFRFFFGVVFYLIFPKGFWGLFWISIIFESARYFILLKKDPHIYESIIDKVVLILMSLIGFSLMK